MPEQKRHLYADKFAELYRLLPGGLPYSFTSADWKQLNDLLQNRTYSARVSLEVFEQACRNFFRSVLHKYELKHLCGTEDFIAFYRGPCNQYSRPKGSNGTRVGESMQTVSEVTTTNWPFVLLRRINIYGQTHPEKADALGALIDSLEGMTEKEAFERLASIEGKE
jgi:hypothetical protein